MEGEELWVIGYWVRKRRSHFFKGERRRPAGSVTHLAGHLFLVAGASCSRPSMERPAPCFEWPLKKQIQRLIFSRTFRECICRASGNFSKPRSGLGMAGAKQRHMGPCLKKPLLLTPRAARAFGPSGHVAPLLSKTATSLRRFSSFFCLQVFRLFSNLKKPAAFSG
jgi:hypothetical protein